MHVLVAEVEQQLASAIARGLRRHGVTVDMAAERAIALALSAATEYDAIVLDQDLQHHHGDALGSQLRARGCKSAILVLIASGTSESVAHQHQRMGADDLLEKPFSIEELLARVRILADSER